MKSFTVEDRRGKIVASVYSIDALLSVLKSLTDDSGIIEKTRRWAKYALKLSSDSTYFEEYIIKVSGVNISREEAEEADAKWLSGRG